VKIHVYIKCRKIVKSIMESLEGSATDENEPGKGTSIILTFKGR
jgi:hypothetical protein